MVLIDEPGKVYEKGLTTDVTQTTASRHKRNVYGLFIHN